MIRATPYRGEVASRVEAGIVTVNGYGSPRGRHDCKGWKESGFGTWSAYAGIEHFMYLRGVIRPAG